MAKTDFKSNYSRCVKNALMFPGISYEYQFDRKKPINEEETRKIMKLSSPKFSIMLENIRQLDAKDRKTGSGKTFKHYIFCSSGIKFLISAFKANGFKLSFGKTRNNDLKVIKLDKEKNSKRETLGVLMKGKLYGKTFTSEMSKEMQDIFNADDNVEGEHLRFLILGKGFEEGISLHNVKYAHILEADTVNSKEYSQILYRAIRRCSHRLLPFTAKVGWTVEVFRYVLRQREKNAEAAYFVQSLSYDTKYGAIVKKLEEDIEKISFDYYFNSSAPEVLNRIKKSTTDLVKKSLGVEKMKEGDLDRFKNMDHKDYQQALVQYHEQYKDPPESVKNGCPPPSKSKVAKKMEKTRRQLLLQEVFKPGCLAKGILLKWTPGSGKTCAAIGIKNNFERANFTILWVTRFTLFNDIWEHMYQKICDDLVDANKIDPNKRRLAFKSLTPMTHKQFSNFCAGKAGERIEKFKRNQDLEAGDAEIAADEETEEDSDKITKNKRTVKFTLKNTLIFLDEVHRLPAKDGPSDQHCDMNAILAKIRNEPTCRVVALTANPFPYLNEEGLRIGIEILKLITHEKEFSSKINVQGFIDNWMEGDGVTNFNKLFKNRISSLNSTLEKNYFAQPKTHEINIYAAQGGYGCGNDNQEALTACAAANTVFKDEVNKLKQEKEKLENDLQNNSKALDSSKRVPAKKTQKKKSSKAITGKSGDVKTKHTKPGQNSTKKSSEKSSLKKKYLKQDSARKRKRKTPGSKSPGRKSSGSTSPGRKASGSTSSGSKAPSKKTASSLQNNKTSKTNAKRLKSAIKKVTQEIQKLETERDKFCRQNLKEECDKTRNQEDRIQECNKNLPQRQQKALKNMFKDMPSEERKAIDIGDYLKLEDRTKFIGSPPKKTVKFEKNKGFTLTEA